jgi:hypothetical protein
MSASTNDLASEPVSEGPPGLSWSLWKLAPFTIPFHVLLPIVLWQVSDGTLAVPSVVWLSIHYGFPLVLLLTKRWWRNQIGNLIGLLVVNHLTTFATILLLMIWNTLL